ncbi:MAG: glycosyltransferase involved in cell wall biosynthesis, partial [Pseudohongiellaceae bacterium]
MVTPDGSAAPLRVLFPVRSDLQTHIGGDSVQVIASARALGRRGVEVVICRDGSANPADFDLVHLWHLERIHETYIYFARAQAAQRPVVLTPIYWPWRTGQAIIREPNGRMARQPMAENLRNLLRWCRARSQFERLAVTKALAKGWGSARSELLHGAAVVMPNSDAEAQQICGESSHELTVQVVPNGVDAEQCRKALEQADDRDRHGVLCVGSFDPRKNQLALIEALRDEDIELTFVGAPRRMHVGYYRRCRRAAGPRMRFLGERSREDILQLMGQARVHVSPSHHETPGLANLEAAALGCTLAVGECAPVREYFGEHSIYMDSEDRDALREGVVAALHRPPSTELQQRVLTHYTWDAA